eukprot:RCo020899
MAHAMSLAFSSVCIRGEGTHLFVALLEGPPPSELRSCACFPSSVFCLQSACAESFAYVSKRPMFYSTAIALTEERELNVRPETVRSVADSFTLCLHRMLHCVRVFFVLC